MSLKGRLELLRKQSGALSAGPLLKEKADLRARLDRLQVGARAEFSPGRVLSAADLAWQLCGELHSEGLVLVEEHLPLEQTHGLQCLNGLLNHTCILPGIEVPGPEKLLFMDTETTGLSGGSGTIAFMLGMARIERDELVIRQYLLTSFAGEKAMLASCADWLKGDETLVTYNGKSFDVPLLTARSRMNSAADVFGQLQHIDLLHPLRRAYRASWPECRLATAEQKLIGFQRVNDLSGAEAPAAWFDWVRGNNPDRLGGVLKHNRWDLLSLLALLPRLARAYSEPEESGANITAVARAWIKVGDEGKARVLLERSRADLTVDGLRVLAWLWRRNSDWERACIIWSKLAEQGDAEAIEQLAKYHEHVKKDFVRALSLSGRLPDGEARRKRTRRLTAKISPARRATGSMF